MVEKKENVPADITPMNRNRTIVFIVASAAVVVAIFCYIAIVHNNRHEYAVQLGNVIEIAYKPKEQHPWKDQGAPMGFVLNGREGATITLVRGRTYRFEYTAPPGIHAFCFTTDPEIGQGSLLIGSVRPFDCTTTVHIGSDFPSELYYQSYSHKKMGGRIFVV